MASRTLISAFFALSVVCSTFSMIFAGERGSSAPFITGDTFRSFVDHVFDETCLSFDPIKVGQGDVIFVKTDWEYLEEFFENYHPKINCEYILVTHNSDHSAPGPFFNYLDDPKLLAWFGQNVEGFSHPKLYPIPIGLANRCWSHGNPDLFKTMLPLSQKSQRSILCYLNFQPATYPTERGYVWDLFANQPWCQVDSFKELSQYLLDLTKAKFVISPRGNGLDCHRTWEALLMGAIPVVRRSSLDSMYEDLPVLIVEDWTVITEDYLNEQYQLLKSKKNCPEKLFINYWITQIRTKAVVCRN